MKGNEAVSFREQVLACVGAGTSITEAPRIIGEFDARCLAVVPEHKREYDSKFQHYLAALMRGDRQSAEAIERDLHAFPMHEVWADHYQNVVTYLGKNAMLDNFIAGSGFTQVGPYMGLISSASWTNLSATISSGTYNTTTGAVSLTSNTAHDLMPGDTFTIASAAGTGSYGALNGTFLATSGTASTTLNFTIVAGLTMTISGGNLTTTSGTRINDTMASHGNWTEAGSSNAPTFAARGTPAWSSAANGSKSTSSAVSFTMTGSGTLEGSFLVLGSGAVTTIGNTSGTLFSAGAFSGGAQPVNATNVVTVSYSLSI